MESELSEHEKLVNYARANWGTKAFSLMPLADIESLVKASIKESVKAKESSKLDMIAEEGSNLVSLTQGAATMGNTHGNMGTHQSNLPNTLAIGASRSRFSEASKPKKDGAADPKFSQESTS